MSFDRAAWHASCTVSVARFYSSIPAGISPSPDTRSPQTSSIVWRTLRYHGPSYGTLPFQTDSETNGNGKWDFVQLSTSRILLVILRLKFAIETTNSRIDCAQGMTLIGKHRTFRSRLEDYATRVLQSKTLSAHLDTAPSVVVEKVYGRGHIGLSRESQEEIELHRVDLVLHEQNL